MPNRRRQQPKSSGPAKAISEAVPSDDPSINLRFVRRSAFLLSSLVALASFIYYAIIRFDTLNLHDPLLGFPDDVGRGVGDGEDRYRNVGLFTVIDVPGKGKGVVATRDIEQGELVIREKPLFVVPHQISTSPTALISHALTQVRPAEREAFYNLSFVNFPADLDPVEHPDEVALAIFQTNGVAAGDGVGIFPRMARLNHGCSRAFNVVYSWRVEEGALVVYALKGIRKGEELLTTYTNTKRPRDQRREYLLQAYGFSCTCSVCSLPDAQSRLSDKRLMRVSEGYERFAAWGHGNIDGVEAIGVAKQIWGLGEEEGYWSERGRLAADVAWVAAAHSDASATSDWAHLALKWYAYELGGDSVHAQEMRDTAVRPQLHRAWGTRERMDVGGPPAGW